MDCPLRSEAGGCEPCCVHGAVQAVHTIHEARIVHSDLKPANFLVVEGQLKLIDFGIAKAISSDTTSIAREAQVSFLAPLHWFPLQYCV